MEGLRRRSWMSLVSGLRGEGASQRLHLQVGDVDRGVGLFCVRICQQSDIGKGPAEQVVDDEDGDVAAGTCHIGCVVGEGRFIARGLAIPLEAFSTAVTHLSRGVSDLAVGVLIYSGG